MHQKYENKMLKLTLSDRTESFEVTVFESTPCSSVVLFAVGSGGNPERHLPLLTFLAESGCTVAAPHFERLVSPIPTEDDLLLRTRRLTLAIDAVAQPLSAVAGVGHSIGAAALVALAGGQMWLGPDQRIDVAPDERLVRLVLLAPPTGFFQAPGALNEIRTPVLAWAGSEDTITPPSQMEVLANATRDHLPVDVRVTEGAGHFSFMDLPPPQSVESLPNRQAFLDELGKEIRNFLMD